MEIESTSLICNESSGSVNSPESKSDLYAEFESKCQSLLERWNEEVLKVIEKYDKFDSKTKKIADKLEKKFLKRNQSEIENMLEYLRTLRQELMNFENLKNKDLLANEKDAITEKFVFTGNTGGGKSTLIHHLTNHRLEWKLENHKPKLIVTNGNGEVIGNNKFQSKTSSCEFYSYENNIYIDCPGSFDSRGLIQEIKNAYCMKALSGLKQVRLVLVVDTSEINATKGCLFKNILEELRTRFDFEKIKASISLIITKGQEDIDDYISDLKEFHQENTTHEYAELFASKGMEKKIAIFPKIKEFEEVSQQWH